MMIIKNDQTTTFWLLSKMWRHVTMHETLDFYASITKDLKYMWLVGTYEPHPHQISSTFVLIFHQSLVGKQCRGNLTLNLPESEQSWDKWVGLMNRENQPLVTDEPVEFETQVEVQDFKKTTDHSRLNLQNVLQITKGKTRTITTSKWLDFETLGFWPTVPKNLSGDSGWVRKGWFQLWKW